MGMAISAEKVRVYLTLSEGLVSRVEAAAFRFGVTKSAVVEAVVDRHLKRFSASSKTDKLSDLEEGQDARTARLQREAREAQVRRDALIGGGR